MGSDMVVARPAATGTGQTLFAANCHRPRGEMQLVRLAPGRSFAAGEVVQTRFLRLPQVRQTNTVLATQAQAADCWGYLHGLSDRRVVAGVADWKSGLGQDHAGLLGPELVRLTLERSHSARHAVDVLTDLIGRHGQGRGGDGGDHIFLIADPEEAFAVEAADQVWAAQEIGQLRAVSDVAVLRQDWYRLAPGLADRAIAEGWWPADGSKLDFAGVLSEQPVGQGSALRRWGRMTRLAEQQNGHIDTAFLRRLLADHYEGTRFEVDPLEGLPAVTPLCQHALHGAIEGTAASALVELPADPAALPVYWLALGPPCLGVYFPLLLEGDLPAALGGGVQARVHRLVDYLGVDELRWLRARTVFGQLQSRVDQDVEEFLPEAAALMRAGERRGFARLVGSLMQSHVERFEETVQVLLGPVGNLEVPKAKGQQKDLVPATSDFGTSDFGTAD